MELRLNTRKMSVLCLIAVAVSVTGCPELVVTEVSVKPGSLENGQKLTLVSKIEVRNDLSECDVVDDEESSADECDNTPREYKGEAVIGLWLPEGWSVSAIRLKEVTAESYETLKPMPELAPGFTRTFPHVPGAWWPVFSGCRDLKVGVTEYALEFDVTGPGDQSKLTAGLLIDTLDFLDLPEKNSVIRDSVLENSENSTDTFDEQIIEIAVDLASGEVSEHRATQRAVELPESRCNAELLEEPDIPGVSPGPRGCGCVATGERGVAPSHLLSFLLI